MSEKKEYIERVDAINIITMGISNAMSSERAIAYSDITRRINAIPAADVEPVVRCPECVNGQRVNNVWTRCAKDGTRRLDSFYCAHGKERERWSNYYGYVSVDALMEFAHNHVNGMIDSNDIARFPKADVKDANEQQSLQEIFGIPFDRLRELAEAERTKHGPQEPNPMGLQTIYFTPYSCDYCGDHIAVGWAFCPECGHRTKNKIASTEPKGDAKT